MRRQRASSSDLVSDIGIPSASVFLNLFTVRGNFELLGLLSQSNNACEGLNLYEISETSKMTRKKCLKRLAELQEIGLVFKAENRYYSSKFGSHIFAQLSILRDTIEIHSKLKAIDDIPLENSLNETEVSDLIQALISNNKVRYRATSTIHSAVLSKRRKADFVNFK
ncbi:MAG TPA: hypothetical protein VH415_10065 [Nitrososphaeraceae archaeon]|jgi:hypothetical protein